MMNIGDVYYEKHTVVGISKRTGTVSETQVERVNVLPIIDVLNKIRDEISAILTNSYDEGVKEKALQIIDKENDNLTQL